MKIYLSHSSGYDYMIELYAPLKESLAREHDIFFPHDEHQDGVNSKDIITASDLIIAETSYPSTGQGIELGWASAASVPIVCMHKSSAKVSSSIRFISDTITEYSDEKEMLTKINELIKERER